MYKNMKKDPRFFQLLAQSFLLFHASYFLGHHFFWEGGVAVLLVGAFIARLFKRPEVANLSFLNTTLSTLILIRSPNLWIWMAIGALAMGAKLLAKERGRHIFNPSNFAIVIALFLFSDVWVDPGLWAQDYGLILFCLVVGLGINSMAHVLVASVTFLFFTFLFEVARSLGLGDPLDITFHNLRNGGLFVFTFFTLTDPKTAPKSWPAQFLYGVLISAFSFSLKYSLFIRGSWFYALFIANMLTPLIYQQHPYLKEDLWKKRFSLS